MGKRGLVIGWLGLLAACGHDPSSFEEATAQSSEPIVGGALDTAHPAAVAYLMNGKCTATIIYVSGGSGWALTAAHCLSGTLGVLRQGQNHASGQFDVQYTVDAVVAHPDYGKAPMFDFAMLHFVGATASTPVMPAISPAEDDLQVGSTVTLVGYGQTESGGTTMRRSIDKPIAELTELRMIYDQSSGGHCFGDSGGPAVRVVAGEDRVAGVASTVTDATPQCSDFGTSSRVSTVFDTFIMPTIAGMPSQLQTCSECFEGTLQHPDAICFDSLAACFYSGPNDCTDYFECFVDDCDDVLGCENPCTALHPQGRAMWDAIFDCVCNTGCSQECNGDADCSPPQCGYQARGLNCDSCLRAYCCSEASACAANAECGSCFPDCPDTSGAAGSLLECLGESCSSFCEVEPTGTGGGGAGTGGGETGTGTSTGTGQGGSGLTGTGAAGAEGGSKPTSSADPDEDGGCDIARAGGVNRRSGWPSTWMLGAMLGAVWAMRRRRPRTLL